MNRRKRKRKRRREKGAEVGKGIEKARIIYGMQKGVSIREKKTKNF